MDSSEEKALELLEQRATDGCIPCSQALRTAVETGIPGRRIGALLDDKGIKIVRCQLGCFGWKEEDRE